MKLAIISHSARIYAQLAKQAGFSVYAVDGYADADLIESSEAVLRWPAMVSGIQPADFDLLQQTLDRWQVDVLVTGSGFEQDHAHYARLFARYRLAGNTPAWVAKVKDPFWLAQTCQYAGVATPQVQASAPSIDNKQPWLIKQRGGCGGLHIRHWQPDTTLDTQAYVQAWQPGISVGGLCIGNGKECQLIGVHRQHQQGFAYAGVTHHHDPALKEAMQQLLAAIYPHMPLLGVFSLDARWDAGQLYLLEVNPRLSASMRIYTTLPLMQSHLAAWAGEPLREMVLPPDKVASHRILYAQQTVNVSALDWPAWCEDRPSTGMVQAGAPLCSLYACAENLDKLQHQLHFYYNEIKKRWGHDVITTNQQQD